MLLTCKCRYQHPRELLFHIRRRHGRNNDDAAFTIRNVPARDSMSDSALNAGAALFRMENNGDGIFTATPTANSRIWSTKGRAPTPSATPFRRAAKDRGPPRSPSTSPAS